MISNCRCEDYRLEDCQEAKRRCKGYIKQANRNYHRANRDAILQRKHEYHYANLNKRIEQGRVWASNRRARKLQATYGNKELNSLVFQEAHKVANLRQKTTGIEYEVDHVIPLLGKNVCGFHSWNNIQVVPKSYNRAKSNKLEQS